MEKKKGIRRDRDKGGKKEKKVRGEKRGAVA